MSNLRFETGTFTSTRHGTFEGPLGVEPYTHLDFVSREGQRRQIESANNLDTPKRFSGGIIYENDRAVAIYNHHTHQINLLVQAQTPAKLSMQAADNVFILAGIFFGGGSALTSVLADDYAGTLAPLVFLCLALARMAFTHGPLAPLRRQRRFERIWNCIHSHSINATAFH